MFAEHVSGAELERRYFEWSVSKQVLKWARAVVSELFFSLRVTCCASHMLAKSALAIPQ